ncbi:MAG: DUF1287 domain-containing protein [Verrucomicrobiae bacterium]|nr:DUF1287 domain-containing protein [Verrucomicrobiae bacterium]NNJ85852.1 DUF1287 domain-containing protein [Akkermansiaceae bacterium]
MNVLPAVVLRILSYSVLSFFLLSGSSCGHEQNPTASKPSGVSDIVNAARTQIGKTVSYDPGYVGLKYPNGDIDISKGVCTDVVIRALRKSRKMDLQQLVHEDMQRNFSKYPKIWGLTRTDKNIDHRRVPNLRTFFKRKGWSLPVIRKKENYQPGDLVTCTVAGKLPHIMIVSDSVDSDGTPLVIHNIGAGAQEEARLFEFPLTGHYRIK